VRAQTKNTAQNSPKHTISNEKFNFFQGWGLDSAPDPSRWGGVPLSYPSHTFPNKPSGSAPASPPKQIPTRSTPLGQRAAEEAAC